MSNNPQLLTSKCLRSIENKTESSKVQLEYHLRANFIISSFDKEHV